MEPYRLGFEKIIDHIRRNWQRELSLLILLAGGSGCSGAVNPGNYDYMPSPAPDNSSPPLYIPYQPVTPGLVPSPERTLPACLEKPLPVKPGYADWEPVYNPRNVEPKDAPDMIPLAQEFQYAIQAKSGVYAVFNSEGSLIYVAVCDGVNWNLYYASAPAPLPKK